MMKKRIKVLVEIDASFDEHMEDKLHDKIKRYFNGKYNHSNVTTFNIFQPEIGFYSWKFAKINAKIMK